MLLMECKDLNVLKKKQIQTSLVVQWLKTLLSQFRGHRLNLWSGNQVPYAAAKTWYSQINNKQISKLKKCIVIVPRLHG